VEAENEGGITEGISMGLHGFEARVYICKGIIQLL
jgi:hypothetical protein